MSDILDLIRIELKNYSDEKTKQASQYFFKDKIKCYGIKSATVKQISKSIFKICDFKSKDDIFRICSELFKSGYIEESFIACHWSYNIRKQFTKDDFVLFEKWVNRNISNWATCDTFCNHTLGEFIEKYPEYLTELKRWTLSENRWMRRAAAVSLIIPAKKGLFLKDIFEIADLLISDNDDMVQKGYGWLLKVACNKQETRVFEYIMNRKETMPRTALRYAIEKMPIELKKQAMVK